MKQLFFCLLNLLVLELFLEIINVIISGKGENNYPSYELRLLDYFFGHTKNSLCQQFKNNSECDG